jgi:hypothetical protein
MPNHPLLRLLPQPRVLHDHGETTNLDHAKLIVIDSPDLLFTAQRLQAALATAEVHWEIVMNNPALPARRIGARLTVKSFTPLIDVAMSNVDQSYSLSIMAGSEAPIVVEGVSLEAVWYGVCTLRQIIAQTGRSLPALTIHDSPDFARRGVMLDISRDKVPTMDTLYNLVDRLADWKINELQLYTEHTFAYQQHKTVWANASPMTSQQILELDRYCHERFIDLVPNQNSFGHMHRWLMHDEYRDLAEYPAGLDWPIFITPRPFSLAAVDPRSIELIAGMYDELLPNFSSRYFNVGCDETADLGRDRSKVLVEEIGVGRAYLQFLSKVVDLAKQHGRIPLVWGDIIMEHPELVLELPSGLIALEWGYEAASPFDQNGARFAASKIPFYVCPGTSSWLSLVGRTDNALANLRNAAINGKKHGAIGYLITDWGDYGHWQPLPVSYLGFAYGAAVSWAVEANLDLDVPAVLNQFAFDDPSGVMGKIAYESGTLYQIVNEVPHNNGAAMIRALYTPMAKLRIPGWLRGTETSLASFDSDHLHQAIKAMDAQYAALDRARPADPLMIDDYRLAMRLWKHGCKRLLIANNDATYSNADMLAELEGLRDDFRTVWLARNRPGGLDDSLVRFDRLFADYETIPTP